LIAFLVITGVLLAVIAVGQLYLAFQAIGTLRELQYGESLVYSHATRILQGQSPYQRFDNPPYSFANYMPLYYLLGAGARALLGPGFGPGRALSTLAGVVAAILVGFLAARQARHAGAGVFAALLFLATGLPWANPPGELSFQGDLARALWANLTADLTHAPSWLGYYRVDLPGVALSLGAIACLSRGMDRRWVVLAGVLAALAILTKQTLFAATVAGTVWLLARDRKAAIIFAGVTLTLALGTCLVVEITTGAFFAGVIAGNLTPMDANMLASTFPMLARFQIGQILVATFFVAQGGWRREPNASLLVCYWLASAIPVAALIKAGSNHNYWIEFAASTSILTTLWLWNHLRQASPSRTLTLAGLAALGITALSIGHVIVGMGGVAILAPSERQRAMRPQEEFVEVIDRVRSTPGVVLASPQDALALADQPIWLDSYQFSALEQVGRWDSKPLVRRICEGQVALLVLDRPLEADQGAYYGYSWWPESVIGALRETMVLQQWIADSYLYVPGPVDPPPTASSQRGVCGS
jgi:hypothetical protein